LTALENKYSIKMQTLNRVQLFLLSILLAGSTLHAQSFNIDWGDKNKVKAKYGQIGGDFIGQSDHVLFQNRTRVKMYYYVYFVYFKYFPYLSSLNPGSLEMLESKPYFPKGLFPKDWGKPNLITSRESDGNVMALVHFYDRKNKRVQFIAQEYNSDCDPAGKPQKLAKVKSERASSLGVVDGVFSPDGQHFALYYNPKDKKKSDETFHFLTFTKSYEQLGESKVVFPVENRFFEVEDVILTNDNKFVVMAAVYEGDGKAKKKKTRTDSWVYHLFIFSTEDGEVEVEDIPLSIKGRYVTGLKLNATDKFIQCAGFYGDKPGLTNGVIYFKYELETGEIGETQNSEFSKEMAREFSTKRQEEGKSMGVASVPRLQVRGLHINKNGSAYLIGEQYSVKEFCSTSSQGVEKCTYTYYYDDIYVAYISESEQIEWVQRIGKRGKFSSSGYSMGLASAEGTGVGFFAMHDPENEDLHIFFNDNPKNGKQVNAGKFLYYRGGDVNTVVVSCSKGGKFQKKVLYNGKERKVRFLPLASGMVNDRQAFLAHARGRNQMNATVTVTQR